MRSMLIGVGLVVGASALGLVSCGGDSATSATTAISVKPTNYVTIPPAPSTAAPVTTAVDAPGSILAYETSYKIAEGDLPVTIATRWTVSFPDLMALNGWILEGQFVTNFPPVGTVIKIPPGATVPGEPVPGADTTIAGDASATTTATTTTPTTTEAGGGSNCPVGEYTILDGDFEGKVATKFDTTLDKLRAANANTNNYSSFYAGLVIKIPAKDDC